MNLKGDYKLLRQGGGRAAFAHVYVQIVDWNKAEDQVATVVDPADSATATPDKDLVLFQAAIEGCQGALGALQARGGETGTYQAIITRLLINRIDTRPDAVRASAFLATVMAFGMQDQFQLVFRDEWDVIQRKEY